VRDLNRFLGWKGQATIDAVLADLVRRIDQLQETATEVKKPRKRRKAKQNSSGLIILIVLICVLVFLIVYFWRP
jgi:hypothetical protein